MQPCRATLKQNGARQCISRKRNCFDKFVIDIFFGTSKAECYHLATLGCTADLNAGLKDYIRNHNYERIYRGLQGPSQVEYRLLNTA